MAKETHPSVAKDLAGVLQLLQDTGRVPTNPTKELQSSIKKIHRATYSLILWRFRLKNVPQHARPFIEEIASDALQILPHAVVGYVKTTHLLTRGIIENSMRYVYFFDHPVEYQLMNQSKKWYMTIKDLFAYATGHPRFVEVGEQFDAFGKLKSLYEDLSGSIHGRRVVDLEMRVALNKIALEQGALDQHVAYVERCAEAVNFALATFHVDQVRGLQAEDRRIILRSISRRGRNIWTDLD